jgi:PTS system mannose-specific IIB component
MKIVLVRVDNRLIHGQILEAWLPTTKANCIVVANNQLVAEGLRKRIMAAAVPRGIRVVIGSVPESVRFLASVEGPSLRVLVLFASPADALNAHALGLHFSHLNLGNLRRAQGEKRFGCSVTLDEGDVVTLKDLEARGVSIHLQCVPTDRQRGWRSLIKEKKS